MHNLTTLQLAVTRANAEFSAARERLDKAEAALRLARSRVADNTFRAVDARVTGQFAHTSKDATLTDC
ncbi:hypothetical protein [Paraburkholderia kururiensis]|uniref:hypothetical protein n=1 Tax=Paraburkholderia kururiensis TaxID=984307 RepID=UPI0005AB7DAD|nr:hypothetical protein [Paraburkholderia kururiensis]